MDWNELKKQVPISKPMSKEDKFFFARIRRYNKNSKKSPLCSHYVRYGKNKVMFIEWKNPRWHFDVYKLEG